MNPSRKMAIVGVIVVVLAASGLFLFHFGSPEIESWGGIEGTITWIDKPVPRMRVGIVSGTTGFPEIAVETNDDGYYHIGSVPPGTFEVAVHNREGNRLCLESVTVRGGETSTLNFVIPWGNAASEIACPKDCSLYVWTPIGTRSENFNWRCLRCGHTWTKTYPEDIYEKWRNAFLEPDFVRDYTLLYLRIVQQMDIPDPLTLDWTSDMETPEEIVGYETYVFKAGGIVVTISYPVVLPENTAYKIKVEVGDLTIWEGGLHRREFEYVRAVYDYYGGIGLFGKGIHIVATSYNPLIREASTSATNTFEIPNDYWRSLKENVTVKASTEDFISIIIARGNKPTGGYTIQVKSFSWLESYPVRFRFTVDFTDPGEGVAVTEAITNPLVLVPIGKLSPGEYVVEVHIDQYILTFDDQGNLVYRLVKTLKEETWEQTFVIDA